MLCLPGVQAGNLARFNRNFRKWKNLSFPEPIFPLITTDVLVCSTCDRTALHPAFHFALAMIFHVAYHADHMHAVLTDVLLKLGTCNVCRRVPEKLA